jgi:hypothetical protein
MTILVEKNIKNKYVFIKLDENGITISLSSDINEFKRFNHYGFIPSPTDLETLKRDGLSDGLATIHGTISCSMAHGGI